MFGGELTHALRALRRRILTPNASATKLSVRGFHIKNQDAQEVLERIGRTFLEGYGHAAEAASLRDAEESLEQIATRYRGFAYEGAAMAYAVRDGLPVGRRDNLKRFLAGRADAHIYMAYVGVGWAMARLPRFRWSGLYAPDPLLRWLVLDGYGFHQAYFRTQRYVHGQFRDDAFRWPPEGPRRHASQVIDQGIGRAMWFVGGTDVDQVTTMIEKFPGSRRADLYCGAALAAVYAGGADRGELEAFRDRAGDHRPQVAQGAAFAAAARERAGLVVPHNELGTEVLCGMTVTEAAELCDRARQELPDDGENPAYAVWRQRIAHEFVGSR
jgi:hypothetical protein